MVLVVAVCVNMSLLNNDVQPRQLTQHDSLLFCMTGPADFAPLVGSLKP